MHKMFELIKKKVRFHSLILRHEWRKKQNIFNLKLKWKYVWCSGVTVLMCILVVPMPSGQSSLIDALGTLAIHPKLALNYVVFFFFKRFNPFTIQFFFHLNHCAFIWCFKFLFLISNEIGWIVWRKKKKPNI